MKSPLLFLEPSDEVAVCLEKVAAGTQFDLPDGPLVAKQDIPAGHKIALVDLALGAKVHKYGQPIGVTSKAIARGEHVHTHNVESDRAGGAHT